MFHWRIWKLFAAIILTKKFRWICSWITREWTCDPCDVSCFKYKYLLYFTGIRVIEILKISLMHLTLFFSAIANGNVRMKKDTNECYFRTIDWRSLFEQPNKQKFFVASDKATCGGKLPFQFAQDFVINTWLYNVHLYTCACTVCSRA